MKKAIHSLNLIRRPRAAGTVQIDRWQLTYLAETITVELDSDIDMDGEFTAQCMDTGETLRVKGWLIEDREHLGYRIKGPFADAQVDLIPVGTR